MNHSVSAVRRRISNLGARLRALSHPDIADELEKISNEVSYFVEARANPDPLNGDTSTNSESVPCDHEMQYVEEYRCVKCGWVSSSCP